MRERRASQGACFACATPVVTTSLHISARCENCRKREHQNYIRRRNERKKQKVCFYCQRSVPIGRLCCAECTKRKIQYDRLRTYGISPQRFNELLVEQGNACAICRSPFEYEHDTARQNLDRAYHSGPHVDHDHRTKVARGLLCNRCNRALGMFGDSIETLIAAANYLSGWLREIAEHDQVSAREVCKEIKA